MRRLTIAFIATCLLGIGASPAAAVAEAPELAPVGVGGRVEVPQQGFALTLPPEWVWVRQSPLDAAGFADTLEVVMDPEDAEEYLSIAGSLQGSFGDRNPLIAKRGDVRGDVSAGEDLVIVLRSLPEAGIEAVVGDLVAAAEGADDVTGLAVDPVTLPVGEVTRIDYSLGPLDYSVYHLTDGISLYLLQIQGLDAPEDRWLSIAETFELLAGEE
jgi:hypothetical protein